MPRYKSLIAALIAALVAMPAALVRADDTDIYIDPRVPPSAEPLVMLSLDYRPNLGSTASPNPGPYFCQQNMTSDVQMLSDLNNGSHVALSADCSNAKMVFFDTLYLSLKLVMNEISGVKIGLMMSHDNVNVNAGYQGDPPRSNNAGSNGGAILYGFNDINVSSTRTNFFAKLLALKKENALQGASATYPYQGTELFYEFFRYLTGQNVYNGHNGWADFGNSLKGQPTNMQCSNTDSTLSPACYDASIETPNPLPSNNPFTQPPSYVSPLASNSACAKIYTVNFVFQVSSQDNDSNYAIGLPKSAGGMGFTPSSSNSFNQVLSFLNGTDLADGTWGSAPNLAGTQNVTSYFVVDPSKVNTTTTGYASAGGTGQPLQLSADPATLVSTLENIFRQILSVSTTFVAASVPVNVFNRAEIVDNIYFALFQADAQKRTHWDGNLKKLKLSTQNVLNSQGQVASQQLVLVDSLGNQAIAADGRINLNALTFWTDITGTLLSTGDTNGDSFVDTYAPGTGPPYAPQTVPNNPGTPANPTGVFSKTDGRIVARGGAGQKLPGFANNTTSSTAPGSGPGDTNPSGNVSSAGPRKLFYLNGNSLAPLEATTTLAGSADMQASLGASGNQTLALQILRYIRGQDVMNSGTNYRYWPLGDPLHSRPLPLNYGASTYASQTCQTDPSKTCTSIPYGLGHTNTKNPAIFIAMGSNDGFLHFFRNTTSASDATAPPGSDIGQEVWAFMPPEGLEIQQRLMNNQPALITQSFHPYAVDGEPTALIIDHNSNGVIEVNSDPTVSDRVILYFGLRRGGRAYYALDVTDPMNPKFLWRLAGLPSNAGTGSLPRMVPALATCTSGSYLLNSAGLNAGTGGCDSSGSYKELALTFSKPRVLSVFNGFNSTTGTIQKQLAIAFGGGYYGGLDAQSDPFCDRSVTGLCPYSGAYTGNPIFKDADNHGNAPAIVGSNDPLGNALYIVKYDDGTLIWKATGGASTSSSPNGTGTQAGGVQTGPRVFTHQAFQDSVASDITAVDTNADGVQDRILFGDTGGNVWRVDLGFDSSNGDSGAFLDEWKLTKLATLGRHWSNANGKADDRHFFAEPDLVQSSDSTGRFDAVILGSGDREDPIDFAGLTQNYFYVLKDRNVGVGAGTDSLTNQGSLTQIPSQCSGSSCNVTVGVAGWEMPLDHNSAGVIVPFSPAPGPDVSEKSVSAATTISNTIFFTTYLPPNPNPSTTSCGPGEGSGLLYAITLDNARPVYNYSLAGGGLITDTGTSAADRSLQLGTPGIPAQVVFLGSAEQIASTQNGGTTGTTNAGGCQLNVLAGAKIFNAPGCPRFRTFWQRKEHQ